MHPDFAHVRTWIFDLDNTLYPASTDLFALIDVRMGEYVQRLLGVDAAEARRVQKAHFLEHGTTLSGLMRSHAIDPREFLDYVHDIEMDRIAEDRRLVEAMARLPGRKLIFTNGDATYAARVLARIGLTDAFEAIHDIHACAYQAKPDPQGYAALISAFDIDPTTALFVEDMARNLVPAKALGMTTVWVDNGSESAGHGADPATIDHVIDDVGAWLHAIQEPDA
ncbi:pyrimidine 5'-nucleotidase [Sphingomonas arantia]|uniref:Pyrimidine 5'-nucleotidase n=1 Tax=Sphingomonas arantia TaxID=1460676 RepID=A0ABW4TRB8_9SPHN